MRQTSLPPTSRPTRSRGAVELVEPALDDESASWFDLSSAVELGLHLAGHHLAGHHLAGYHLAAGIEVLIDLGKTPPARGIPGTVALLVAQLAAVSAKSARDLPGSTVSVRVASDAEGPSSPSPTTAPAAPGPTAIGELARTILAPGPAPSPPPPSPAAPSSPASPPCSPDVARRSPFKHA